MEKIKTKVRVTKIGFMGYISDKDHGQYLWSESTGIDRPCKADAYRDAQVLKSEIVEAIMV